MKECSMTKLRPSSIIFKFSFSLYLLLFVQMVGDKCLYRSRPYYWRKCKRVRGTNIDSLPDELLLHILARLSNDPHYLYNKARVVCRRWCHLIRSRDFIKMQLHRSTYGLLFSLLDHATIISATQSGIETREIPYDGSYLRSLSSCNGLVLLQRHGSDPMHIVNPATRQQLILPSISCEGYAEAYHMRCGIGYAADSMVYKVVVPYVTVKGQVFLAILSVGVDKSWRRVGDKPLSGYARAILIVNRTVACNTEGFITWSNYDLAGMYLTLHVETEILTLHPGPLPKDHLKRKWTFYLSTGRSLSLLIVDLHKKTKYVVEFWEMKEESGEWRKVTGDIKLGAHAGWLKQICGGGGAFMMPLGWVRFPEVLALYFRPFIVCATNYCVFFNLNTQEIWSMELPKEDGYYYAQAHKTSLAWIT